MTAQHTEHEDFASLFQEEAATRKKMTPGQKVKARVVGISDEYIFLDVGGKSEGYLRRSELTDDEGNLSVAEGDEVETFFLATENHEMLFTTKIGSGPASKAFLEEAYRAAIPVEGLVAKEVKGGYEVTVSGNIRCFCPFSQVSLRRVDGEETFIGQHFLFKIMEYKENGRNIILSRRQLLEEERQEQKDKLRQTLKEGMLVKGTVTSVREFGAFVDIGGVEGLIPISEVGWSRVENINDYLTQGQEVEVTIKKLDWENDRFSFSLKEALPDPWHDITRTFPEGSTHTGTVVRLTKFGAFITLAPGIDGLIHISALGGGRRINHPREAVAEGQAIEVRIDKINTEEKRISLALAAATEEAAEDETGQKEFRDYTAKSEHRADTRSMGTLGELLKSQLDKKE